MNAFFRNAASACLLILATAGMGIAEEPQPQPPTLPLQQVDMLLPPSQGKTLRVAAGGDFQMVLDQAVPGDVIELEAGAEFRGPFTLPAKSGAGWIVIRSSSDTQLPPPDSRVTPTHAPFMPRLVAASDFVLATAPGAHHYRFVGIEIRPDPDVFLYNLVLLGNGSESRATLPHHIVFDRCYLHGDPRAGTRRGIAMNGAHIAVMNSWLADFKEVDADSQAIAGWNGTGPFKIANNHLEAAGENVMFGGATPTIAGLVPADIEIRGNHLFKSLAWKANDPMYAGTPWTVKNLLELQNGRRVLIEGNVFEHSWSAAERGFAVLLTVRNDDGAVPWAAVEDITFRSNLLSGVAGGINILGRDDNDHPSSVTSRISINNNLFADMGGNWGPGPLVQLLDGVQDLTVEYNTALNSSNVMVSEGKAHTNVRFTRNIVMDNNENFIDSGAASGLMLALPREENENSGVDLPVLCAALGPLEYSRYCSLGTLNAGVQ